METIELSEVLEGTRTRIDYGEVVELAESIRDEGLMQPIVLSRDKRLVAGGRRFRAFNLLASGDVKSEDPTQFAKIPYVTIEEHLESIGRIQPGELISESKLRKLELEENVRRKSMHWTERVISIYEYHQASRREAIASSEKWSQQETGHLLGLAQSRVSTALTLAQHLMADPEGPLTKCASAVEALQLLLQQKADETAAALAARSVTRRAETQMLDVNELIEQAKQQSVEGVLMSASTKEVISYDACAAMVHLGDAIKVIPQIGRWDHIICDPPYGIDMKNLDTYEGIERVTAEHKIEPNKKLLKAFLSVAYNHAQEHSFLCMWYDLDLHELLAKEAERIGWTVCRWPFHWIKTSPCRNSVAQYNMTKAVEHCMIMRKSATAVLAKPMSKNYVLAGAAGRSTHPFYKPEEVWTPLLEHFTMKGQTILDPFAGECSSLVAAFRAERSPIGIELVKEHAASGVANLHAELNKQSKSYDPGL